ncbi:MAG: beta-N-acetylhexosaminidase [Promethearchaeota archaeon]
MNKNTLKLIPKPLKIKYYNGFFNLSDSITIYFQENTEDLSQLLSKYAKEILGLNIHGKKIEFLTNEYEEMPNGIFIDIKNANSKIENNSTTKNTANTNNSTIENAEKYKINIEKEKIILSAVSKRGIFYAIQTLRQIFYNLKFEKKDNNNENNGFLIPTLEIEDYPYYEWRGLMLDEARHFQGEKNVKKILDIMALLKMNKFHWHLTDDQGWRIEIRKYKKLTEEGAKRRDTQTGGILSKKFENKPHEGFYSQEKIRNIINYAKERFIEIIPEIDMPGHSMAALATYPEYCCLGKKFDVPTTFGIKKDVFCVGNEKTFDFLEDILKEIIELFPSKYIHIGGDEVPTTRWKSCKKCQKLKKDLNLKKDREIQGYFNQRICNFLLKNNKIPIGWNEILADSLDPKIIVQYWLRNKKLVKKHLKNGRKFIISKFGYLYFDYNYSLTPLKKVYKFNPCFKGLSKEACKNILGMECTVWTEWIYNEKRLFWQIFPRLFAVSEICWRPLKLRIYSEFQENIPLFLKILNEKGIYYESLDKCNPPLINRIFKLIRLRIIDPYGGDREK